MLGTRTKEFIYSTLQLEGSKEWGIFAADKRNRVALSFQSVSPPPAASSAPSAPRCASAAQPAASACARRSASAPAAAAAAPPSAPCWPAGGARNLALRSTPPGRWWWSWKRRHHFRVGGKRSWMSGGWGRTDGFASVWIWGKRLTLVRLYPSPRLPLRCRCTRTLSRLMREKKKWFEKNQAWYSH